MCLMAVLMVSVKCCCKSSLDVVAGLKRGGHSYVNPRYIPRYFRACFSQSEAFCRSFFDIWQGARHFVDIDSTVEKTENNVRNGN